MNSTARIVALQLLASRHVGAPCLAAGNAEDNAKPAAAATGDIDFTSASSCRRASTGLMSSSMAIWEQWSVEACRMSSRASSFFFLYLQRGVCPDLLHAASKFCLCRHAVHSGFQLRQKDGTVAGIETVQPLTPAAELVTCLRPKFREQPMIGPGQECDLLLAVLRESPQGWFDCTLT